MSYLLLWPTVTSTYHSGFDQHTFSWSMPILSPQYHVFKTKTKESKFLTEHESSRVVEYNVNIIPQYRNHLIFLRLWRTLIFNPHIKSIVGHGIYRCKWWESASTWKPMQGQTNIVFRVGIQVVFLYSFFFLFFWFVRVSKDRWEVDGLGCGWMKKRTWVCFRQMDEVEPVLVGGWTKRKGKESAAESRFLPPQQQGRLIGADFSCDKWWWIPAAFGCG